MTVTDLYMQLLINVNYLEIMIYGYDIILYIKNVSPKTCKIPIVLGGGGLLLCNNYTYLPGHGAPSLVIFCIHSIE